MTPTSWATAADADCELRRDGFFDQDVNAWSSLGYVGVGAAIATVVVRRRLPAAFHVLAALAALEGVGSLLYHGRGGDAAQLLHDVPLVAALGFVAGWQWGRLLEQAGRWSVVGAGVGAAGGVAVSLAGVTNVAVAAVVAVVVVTELVGRRRGHAAIWTLPLLALTALAVAVWFAGTSGSPLCDEESWLQPHGAWHVLSALVLLVWMDAAANADAGDRAPRLVRAAVDRALGLLAWALAHAFYRTIEVVGREHLGRDRPVLLVANHGNGFVDPVVVTAVRRRLPRFLAKAALWKVVVARPFLALAGVLPVHRRADGDRAEGNRSVFEACHRELARGSTVAIFPEGTTGDRAGLDRVKSGAARIALGAADGARALVVVPVGLAFESRTETRGRALVMVGAPIEVAARPRRPIGADGEPDHGDVDALTADITAALEAVSPEFATVEERELLRAAARVARNAERDRGTASFGEVEVLARRLAAADPAARLAVVDAYRRFAAQLQVIGLTDRQLAPASSSGWRLLASVAALVLLGSLVVTAVLVHLPALLVTFGATAAVRSTATKGTVRLLVGLVTGLLTWAIAGAIAADGWAAVGAGALVALEGALALAVLTPLTRLIATVWGWLGTRDRVGLLPPALAERAAVVAAVEEAAA